MYQVGLASFEDAHSDLCGHLTGPEVVQDLSASGLEVDYKTD